MEPTSGGKGLVHDGDWTSSAAPSLTMWSKYFTKATIFGFDLNDFTGAELPPRCTVIQGDSSSRVDLARPAAFCPFDVIIDDASHASPHQQTALGYMWRTLSPGGLYFIEDLHWQPPMLERADVPTTRDLLRRFELDGIIASPCLGPEECEALQNEATEVALFDSLEPPRPGAAPGATRDALAVLWRRS